MDCEVIVVGGGVGGLVTAALLAARGVDVCLFERQPHVGGCVAAFEHAGYQFEPTAGLYSGWDDGGTWQRLFSELPLPAPAVTRLSPNFIVRLADGTDVEVCDDRQRFESNLRSTFQGSAESAITFLRELARMGEHQKTDSFPVASLLSNCSPEFRDFVDVQLQTFAQCTSSECSVRLAAETLKLARGSLWSIDRGAHILANGLADSLRASGGRLRLDAPVLRLAYEADGTPMGIDLLSGERVTARRAIISNLTVWDTYGKLVGLNRLPTSLRSHLKNLSGWGAYLLFLALEDPARLPPTRMMVVCERNHDEPYSPDSNQLVVSVGSEPATSGNWPVTVSTFTRAEDWFSFHEDSSMHEEHDEEMLKTWWKRLHSSIPELGDTIEVIETATPHTFYATTRRRLGVIGRPSSPEKAPTAFIGTHLPNLFLVGDTASGDIGLEGVARGAYELANLFTH